MKRWIAFVYPFDADEPTLEWEFDEISELHELVENGPDWNDIDEIVIQYRGGDDD